jgi:ATP-binding cassette, subfamily B, bacterial PglK
MDAVRALHGRKTLLIVAHRLSTVEGCDQLFRLEGGSIVAEGAPEKVLAEPAASD